MPCNAFAETQDNITVDGKFNHTFTECLSEFYATNAHWDGHGALASFNRFAEKGIPEYAPLGNITIDDGAFHFNGGGSRMGLMLLNKEANEPLLATSRFVVDEGPEAYALSHDGDSITSNLYNEYNFYSAWYGGHESLRTTSLDDLNRGRALIVHDSFGYSFRWMMAATYSGSYDVTGLCSSSKEDVSFEERLTSSDANTVFLVRLPHDFATFLDRHPRYFELTHTAA